MDALFDAGGYAPPPAPPPPFGRAEIIEAAVRYFRARGFPYREISPHRAMQEINKLASTPPAKLPNTMTALEVADAYHPHRYECHADGRMSPLEAFARDDLLRRALEMQFDKDGRLSDYPRKVNYVWGAQACSNFRPGFAAHIYRRFCPPGGTVLDPSTGYGGRLVGAIASGVVGRYIGIDPNRATHAGNRRLADDVGGALSVELINLPAEDVAADPDGLAGSADFAFTSPPYFCKERYSDEDTQSWRRYPTFEGWVAGFLRPMMALQATALHRGCVAVVNVADVKIRDVTHPLVEATVEAGEAAGLVSIARESLALQTPHNAENGRARRQEALLVFRKEG